MRLRDVADFFREGFECAFALCPGVHADRGGTAVDAQTPAFPRAVDLSTLPSRTPTPGRSSPTAAILPAGGETPARRTASSRSKSGSVPAARLGAGDGRGRQRPSKRRPARQPADLEQTAVAQSTAATTAAGGRLGARAGRDCRRSASCRPASGAGAGAADAGRHVRAEAGRDHR